MKLKTLLTATAALGVAAFASWGWYESRCQWIDAGYVGILYDATAGVSPQAIPPRRVFVGWRQRLYTYPTKLQSAKYIQAADEGEVKSADGVLITTSDNANTTFDVSVVYRVKPSDALTVFNNFGPTDVQTIQSTHIRRAVKDAVNEVGPRYDIFQLMGPKRQEFSTAVTKILQTRLATKGLSVEGVYLMTAYPTPETMEKINRRINQYTEYEIAVLRQQIAEVTRQSNVLTARARMEAQRLVSATAKDKGLLQLQLQADSEAIEKWDGRLPTIRSAPGQTLVLGSESLAVRTAQTKPQPQQQGANNQ